MPRYICVTCGTQYPESDAHPAECPICEDDRQYVNPNGQTWTTLDEVRAKHHNSFTELAPGLTAIQTTSGIGIGQRAHLLETPAGNVLWDCLTLIDDDTVAEIERRGGLAAIAISHPHFFTTIAEWSQAFGGIPIYLHRENEPWVMHPGDHVHYWDGDTFEPLAGSGLTLIRCGGHFPGSTVIHWPDGFDGAGALFTGDTIYVVADNRWVTFLYSYPNDIPLSSAEVRRIAAAVAPYRFDRLYSAFGRPVEEDANGAVQRSAERYIAHIEGRA
jgi:glyoxylase-like metal-dependent hydrolase (beta-lactamase superfamily II)